MMYEWDNLYSAMGEFNVNWACYMYGCFMVEYDELGMDLIWDKKWWLLTWYRHEVQFYIRGFGKDELLLIQHGIWMRNG